MNSGGCASSDPTIGLIMVGAVFGFVTIGPFVLIGVNNLLDYLKSRAPAPPTGQGGERT